MIFGNWRPGGLAAGAVLFGYTDALQLRRGSESVHALLMFIAVILLALGGVPVRARRADRRRRQRGARRAGRRLVRHDRPDPGRVRAGDAVRHHARGAGAGHAAAATSGRGRPAVPEG